MRKRRFKRSAEESAVYHVVTRTVNGMFLFEEADREMLRRMLWKAAEFSGVQVLTYCLLSNHFHVLLRVPVRSAVSDAELVRRYRALYPHGRPGNPHQAGHAAMAEDPGATIEAILAQGGPEAEALRTALLRRMNDVSEFMKTLKQRFTMWYNMTHDRFGTLWAERFKSVLVEDDGFALSTVAAYIDLNPVRAKLVEDPKDYRWCGYGEAVGEGGERIRAGLGSILRGLDWSGVLKAYRVILFGKGTRRKADGSEAGEIPWEQARQVLNDGGRLPAATVLRCRVRYFTDGAALGSPGFVVQALRAYQEMTGLRRRQCEPRPLAGSDDWTGLTTLRGLRRAVFT
jgi:REP element-mobilizing transposase RayT